MKTELFENDDASDNHVIFLSKFSSNTEKYVFKFVFKFLRRSVDGKHLMRFQIRKGALTLFSLVIL